MLLIASLILACVLGKVIGIGYFARFFGIRGHSARLFGVIMIPRGNENIAIVQIILALGVISFQVYTSIIFAMVATILLTPVLIKAFYR